MIEGIIAIIIGLIGAFFYGYKSRKDADKLKRLREEAEAVKQGKIVDYEVDQLSDEELRKRFNERWSK